MNTNTITNNKAIVSLELKYVSAIRALSNYFDICVHELQEQRDAGEKFPDPIYYYGDLEGIFPHLYANLGEYNDEEGRNILNAWMMYPSYVEGYEWLKEMNYSAVRVVALAVATNKKYWKQVIRDILYKGYYDLRWGWCNY